MKLIKTCKHCGKKLFFVYYETYSTKHGEFITLCKNCKDSYFLTTRNINILSEILSNLRWKFEMLLFDFRTNLERMQHNISERDIWNFNEVLPKLLRKAIRYHRIYSFTYPNEFENYREWKKVLREMELGFKILEEYYKTIENNPDCTMPEKHRKIVDKSFELLKKYHWALWD